MAITHVQTTQGRRITVGTDAVTAGITTTTGNLLVATLQYYQSAGVSPFTSFADSNVNTWYQVGTETSTGSTIFERMYYAKNITGGASHTFTLTTDNNASYPALIVSEFAGADTTAPFDVTSTPGTGSSTSPASSATATRAQAAEVVVGSLCVQSGDISITAGTNFVIPTNGSMTSGSDGNVGALEYQIVSSTGTDAATFTIDSNPWICRVATFKAAATNTAALTNVMATGTVGTVGVDNPPPSVHANFRRREMRPAAFKPGNAR